MTDPQALRHLLAGIINILEGKDFEELEKRKRDRLRPYGNFKGIPYIDSKRATFEIEQIEKIYHEEKENLYRKYNHLRDSLDNIHNYKNSQSLGVK